MMAWEGSGVCRRCAGSPSGGPEYGPGPVSQHGCDSISELVTVPKPTVFLLLVTRNAADKPHQCFVPTRMHRLSQHDRCTHLCSCSSYSIAGMCPSRQPLAHVLAEHQVPGDACMSSAGLAAAHAKLTSWLCTLVYAACRGLTPSCTGVIVPATASA
jgi:hypothetical protein